VERTVGSECVCAEYDDSVSYVDYDDDEEYLSRRPIYETPPYVCGRVLLASVLDSLVTMVSRRCCRCSCTHTT